MALTHNSFQVKIMVVFLAIMLLMSSAAAASTHTPLNLGGRKLLQYYSISDS
ncbi:hypothetical protein V6Z12_D05G345200 [Gossypium hirsutum]